MEGFFKELGQHFWGEKSAAFHVIGMLFSLGTTLIAKAIFYKFDKKTTLAAGQYFPQFNLKRWVKENCIDVLISVAASFLVVRFVDYIFHFMVENNIKILGYSISNADDQLVFYVVFAAVIQIYAHKLFKPIRNPKTSKS